MARADPRNITHYWWDRETPGLSLLRADFTTHDYAPHVHDAFVVAVTEEGGAVIKSRGVVEQACSGALLVFNPAEPQSSWMGRSRHWVYRGFYLTQSAVDCIAHSLGIEAVPYFMRNTLADADLVDRFLALHRALEDGQDPFRQRELLTDAFGRLFQRHGSGGDRIEPAPHGGAVLRAAINMMRARHADSLRLEELGDAVGLTPFQLIGLFKRAVGLTPHAYLTQIRLNVACRALRRGRRIADVAAACGFCDQSALTTHFKRCYGITPLQFAKAASA